MALGPFVRLECGKSSEASVLLLHLDAMSLIQMVRGMVKESAMDSGDGTADDTA